MPVRNVPRNYRPGRPRAGVRSRNTGSQPVIMMVQPGKMTSKAPGMKAQI